MADDQDQSQKTEEPTHKRMEEAFKRGQVPFSREVTSFLMLFVLALTIAWFSKPMMVETKEFFRVFIERPQDIDISGDNLYDLMIEVLGKSAYILLLPVLATMVAALMGSFMQNGIVMSVEPIKPKLEKISPVKGIKRLFSMRSMIEFIKGLIKLAIVGTVAYVAAVPLMNELELLPSYEVLDILAFIGQVMIRMMIGVCAVMALIAVLDVLYQRFEHKKNLRMSKQEIKDEMKQQEGDPHIKAKLRAIRMERAQRRMMAAVPEADVVVTNPTHFAVAMKYVEDVMSAPIVVAKGQDHIALKIREVAKEHDIPIVENPPLARALYESAEIDQEIPLDHYQAVAEVISYVYKLQGKL